MSTESPGEYLCEKAAARILNVSPRTLRDWRKQGLIGFHRMGGTIRYTLDDLINFAAATRVPPKAQRPA